MGLVSSGFLSLSVGSLGTFGGTTFGATLGTLGSLGFSFFGTAAGFKFYSTGSELSLEGGRLGLVGSTFSRVLWWSSISF